MPLYLDYNATSPVHPEVLSTMISVYTEHYGNAGSRTHVFGQDASKTVETARGEIAKVLGVSPKEVIFTSGATESNNLAILGLAQWGEENGRRHIVTTAIEHKSVLEPMNYLSKRGFEVEYVMPGVDGMVDRDSVMAKIRPDTLLVSVMHANNETGAIQPVLAIGEDLAKTPVYFHIDAAQTFGKLPDLRDLHYDLLSISGHKIYGPQGIGALVVRRNGAKTPPVRPLTFGGGQERGLRPGTLPVALIAALGKAASIAQENQLLWNDSNLRIKNRIIEQLERVSYCVNADLKDTMPNCLNVSFEGIDSEALMVAVKDYLAISNGSACTSASYSPSHVLTAMGLPPERIAGAVRISWGPELEDVDLEPLLNVVVSFQHKR